MSSLIIQRVGLRFLAHLLKINSRHAMELRKAERIDTQINSKSENRNLKYSVGSDYPNTMGRINISKKPDYPTQSKQDQILSASISQRACFGGLKNACWIGLSDGGKYHVGQ